jgi:hypothetical protein
MACECVSVVRHGKDATRGQCAGYLIVCSVVWLFVQRFEVCLGVLACRCASSPVRRWFSYRSCLASKCNTWHVAGFIQLHRSLPELQKVKCYVHKDSSLKNVDCDRLVENYEEWKTGWQRYGVQENKWAAHSVSEGAQKSLIVWNLVLEQAIFMYIPCGTVTA